MTVFDEWVLISFRAAQKIFGLGLRMPTAAEVRMVSKYGRSPA